MTFYHPHKQQAQEEANEIALDPRVEAVKVEFDAGNGWVVVVFPKPDPLTDLHDRFEVRCYSGRRLSKLPKDRVTFKREVVVKPPPPPVKAPPPPPPRTYTAPPAPPPRPPAPPVLPIKPPPPPK